MNIPPNILNFKDHPPEEPSVECSNLDRTAARTLLRHIKSGRTSVGGNLEKWLTDKINNPQEVICLLHYAGATQN